MFSNEWLATLLLFLPLLVWAGQATVVKEGETCADCHPRQQAEFLQSRMAEAARTAAFLDEWRQKGEPESCFGCHSPTRSEGVACVDCHGSATHPYPRLNVPAVCAPCHDAPGEITLLSYHDSSAARRGEDCLTCHLQESAGRHDFQGPTRPGFLRDIASLTIAFRRDAEGDAALLRLRHKAGHALPGGTTGRAVWLVVEQADRQRRVLDTRYYRFGWLHSPETGWQDNTLAAGVGKVIEVPLHEGATTIHAKLIYRFRAGGLDIADPDQVVLLDESRLLTFRAN